MDYIDANRVGEEVTIRIKYKQTWELYAWFFVGSKIVEHFGTPVWQLAIPVYGQIIGFLMIGLTASAPNNGNWIGNQQEAGKPINSKTIEDDAVTKGIITEEVAEGRFDFTIGLSPESIEIGTITGTKWKTGVWVVCFAMVAIPTPIGFSVSDAPAGLKYSFSDLEETPRDENNWKADTRLFIETTESAQLGQYRMTIVATAKRGASGGGDLSHEVILPITIVEHATPPEDTLKLPTFIRIGSIGDVRPLGTVEVRGELTADTVEKLSGYTVTVTSEGKIVTATTGSDEKFLATFTAPAMIGTYTVTALFEGTEGLESSRTTTTYQVTLIGNTWDWLNAILAFIMGSLPIILLLIGFLILLMIIIWIVRFVKRHTVKGNVEKFPDRPDWMHAPSWSFSGGGSRSSLDNIIPARKGAKYDPNTGKKLMTEKEFMRKYGGKWSI
jgi:hypothetical protein